MSELTDADIERVQGQSFRTGQLSGQQEAINSVLALIRQGLGENLQLTSFGWQIPEAAYKTVLTSVSQRLEEDAKKVGRQFDDHRSDMRAAREDASE